MSGWTNKKGVTLSVRIENALWNSGFQDPEILKRDFLEGRITQENLLRVKNIGPKAPREILSWLDATGRGGLGQGARDMSDRGPTPPRQMTDEHLERAIAYTRRRLAALEAEKASRPIRDERAVAAALASLDKP